MGSVNLRAQMKNKSVLQHLRVRMIDYAKSGVPLKLESASKSLKGGLRRIKSIVQQPGSSLSLNSLFQDSNTAWSNLHFDETSPI